MKRIALFLLTNIAILLVLSLVLRLLGVDRILDESGSGLNYNSLFFEWIRITDFAFDIFSRDWFWRRLYVSGHVQMDGQTFYRCTGHHSAPQCN